jgi:hypothetical protein
VRCWCGKVCLKRESAFSQYYEGYKPLYMHSVTLKDCPKDGSEKLFQNKIIINQKLGVQMENQDNTTL